MDKERNFRNASHDLPPLSPAEFIAQPRPEETILSVYGWIAAIIFCGIVCAAFAIVSSRAAPLTPQELIDSAFDAFVDQEAQDLDCELRCTMGTDTNYPKCRRVCGKGRV